MEISRKRPAHMLALLTLNHSKPFCYCRCRGAIWFKYYGGKADKNLRIITRFWILSMENSVPPCMVLHNPFKAPQRYLLYGYISTNAAHMLALPKVRIITPFNFVFRRCQGGCSSS